MITTLATSQNWKKKNLGVQGLLGVMLSFASL
jgi:hypothetical protein